jgi:hypothetical protein
VDRIQPSFNDFVVYRNERRMKTPMQVSELDGCNGERVYFTSILAAITDLLDEYGVQAASTVEGFAASTLINAKFVREVVAKLPKEVSFIPVIVGVDSTVAYMHSGISVRPLVATIYSARNRLVTIGLLSTAGAKTFTSWNLPTSKHYEMSIRILCESLAMVLHELDEVQQTGMLYISKEGHQYHIIPSLTVFIADMMVRTAIGVKLLNV